jgi:MFS family permease
VTAARLLAPVGRTFASVRKHRNYRLFFAGQVVSNTGTWMQRIAQAWLVVRLTDSPLAIGVLAVCQYAPFTVLGLFAGVVSDRWEPRRIVLATQTVSMLLAGAMAGLAWSGAAELWHVYLIGALMGLALVVDAPARQALTFQMVGRDELPNAVALNASVFNAARVVGPAAAGALIATAGVGVCFAVNAASFVAVLAGLLAMRRSELFPLEGRERPTLLRGSLEGLAYAFREPRVRLALGMVLVLSVLCFNFQVLLPVLASDTLAAGPGTFGAITAFFGAGALAGALLSAGIATARWRVLLTATGLFGATQLVLAPLESTAAACAVLLIAGVAFTVCTSTLISSLQLASPDHLRGRVLGLYLYAFAGSIPFSGLLVGWLADTGGTRLALWVSGGAALLTVAVAAAVLRHQRPPQGPSPRRHRTLTGALPSQTTEPGTLDA